MSLKALQGISRKALSLWKSDKKSSWKPKFLKSSEKTQIKKPSQLCYETASIRCKEKTETLLPQAKKDFFDEGYPQGSPSEHSEDGNPIFHPSKKSVPGGADLFFPT